jgi:hypothetical protein
MLTFHLSINILVILEVAQVEEVSLPILQKNDVVIVIVTNFSDPIYPVAGLMFNLLSQIENL